MNEEIEERVSEVVADTFNLDPGEIGSGTSAWELGAWTSLAHLRLVSNLEQVFGVHFTMEEMTSMMSVAAIAHVLASRGVRA